MPNNPLVSVILPCYNAAHFLPEALDSIINQTYRNLEILCINDGSTDKTPEILENYVKKDNRIRVIHNQTNLKLIRTLNKGIDLANGEYIARMDADDVSLPERIEKQVAYMQQNSVDMVSTFADFVSETGKITKGMRTVYTTYPYTFFYTFFINPFIHPTVLAKRAVLKENKYSTEPNALHNEDYELWTRILRKGYKIEILPEVLLLYRYNSESVSSQNVQLQLDNFTRNLQKHINKTLQIEIRENFAALLTFNPSGVFQVLSMSDITDMLNVIIESSVTNFHVNKNILQAITQRHNRRLRLFLFRNHPAYLNKFVYFIQILMHLRAHYLARKKL